MTEAILIFFLNVAKVPMITTESGLQYKDIKVGQGSSPPVGFQVRKAIWLVQVFLYTCH